MSFISKFLAAAAVAAALSIYTSSFFANFFCISFDLLLFPNFFQGQPLNTLYSASFLDKMRTIKLTHATSPFLRK